MIFSYQRLCFCPHFEKKKLGSLNSLHGRRLKGKGKEEFGHAGRTREKGKERLRGDHCFLHFSCSDSELEIFDLIPFSDWLKTTLRHLSN